MSGPLSGIRVIEFAGIGPGPFCGMMLADHGAEVIRIEKIGSTDRAPDAAAVPARQFLNRSRKSFAVDLKNADGCSLVRRLCASAHAVFEGFRPGVMERLGLGPDVLIGANPGLVYGRMTGWGQDGPYAHAAGHDINYIALSGALHSVGRADQKPTPPINLVGDFGGGGMMLAFGMLAAIIHARATGQGQVVDCAMTEGSSLLMSMVHQLRAQGDWQDQRGVNFLDSGSHYYDSYETADGRYIAIGAVEPAFYAQLLQLIGFGEAAEFAAQNDRTHWHRLKEKMAERFRTKTRDEWCAILERSDACFAPVMSLDEAPMHPHNVARKAFVDINGLIEPAPAPRYSKSTLGTPAEMASGVEVVRSLLHEIRCSDAQLEDMRARGVLA